MNKKVLILVCLLFLVALLISCGPVEEEEEIITPEQPEQPPTPPEAVPEAQPEEEPEEIVGEWVVEEERNKTGLDVIDRPGEVIFIREDMEIEGAMCLPVSIFSKKCIDLGDGRINITVSNGLGSIQGIYFKMFSVSAKTGFEHFTREVAPRKLSSYVIDIDKWKAEFGEGVVKVEAFPEIEYDGEMKVCINKKLSFNPNYSCKVG